MRVNIPGNPDEFITLAKSVLAKHVALGAASPLNGIPGIAGFAAQVGVADTQNLAAKDFAQKSETATEARDNAIGATTDTAGSLQFFVTSARDLLLAINKSTEHKLGDWGYQVITSTAPTPPATPTPPHP